MVTKIWSRSGGDVFARIATQGQEGEEHLPRITIKFPGGRINGEDISLMAGDTLFIKGWISDGPYSETLVNFLSRAKRDDIFEICPELKEQQTVEVKRAMSYVIPETIELISTQDQGVFNGVNQARVEGIVARVWEHRGSKFVRLAVYDRYAVAQDGVGKYDRPKRTPHYVTIRFQNGMVGGRPVTLLPKGSKVTGGIRPGHRLRIAGTIGESFYKENLRTFLLTAGQAEVLSKLTNANVVDEVWSSFTETCVVAQNLIHYTTE